MNADIPADVQTAYTLADKVDTVKKINESETVRVVKYLARIDRQSIGWITILVKFIIGIFFTVALLLVNIIFLAIFANYIYKLAFNFLQFTRPGVWVAARSALMHPISHRTYLIMAILVLVVVGVALFRSTKFREQLTGHLFWPGRTDAPMIIRLVLRFVQVITWICMIVFTGAFLALAIYPIVFLLFDLWTSVTYWIPQLTFVGPVLRQFWYYLILPVGFLALFVFLARKIPRSKLIRLDLFFIGGFGIVDILVTASRIGWTDWRLILFFCLFMIYPIGLAVKLAGLFIGPFSIFRKTIYALYMGLSLRWYLLVTIRHHRKRNHEQTAGDIWSTVCKDHLLRFEKRSERLSYSLKFVYGCCPECEEDVNVYQGVECLAIKLDKAMTSATEQAGPTLWLNGLQYLRDTTKFATPPYDSVVVGQVDDHDVENFILSTTNQAQTVNHKPLGQIPARICAGSNITGNDLNILQRNVAQVTQDYDPGSTPNPYMGNLRVKEAVQKGSLRILRAARNVGLAILLLVLFTGSLYALNRFNVLSVLPEQIMMKVKDWLSTL